MTVKAISCMLACQLVVPVVPTAAGTSRQEKANLRWIEGTLIGVDPVQRSVSYRVEPGDVRTAAVGSDAALRRLTGLKAGQPVKLKCRQTSEGNVIVEEAKKRGGWPWWAWVLTSIAAAGVVWLLLLFNASE